MPVPHPKQLAITLALVILASSALIYSLQTFSGKNAGPMNSATVSTVSNLIEPGLSLLSVNGTQIVDLDGNIVVLRGVNLSGYETFPPEWFHNESDFKTIASWGFNVIRLPISWDNIEPIPGEYNDSYLRLVDQDITWAKENAIYVVLDMHENCWSKQFASCNNGYTHGIPKWAVATYQDSSQGIQLMLHDFYLGLGSNGTTPSPTNPSIQRRFFSAWKYVASRYSNETAIAAYDILNEPTQEANSLGDNYTFTAEVLPDFFANAIDVIRSVDSNHICMWEGPTSIPVHRPNVAYSPHYPQSSLSFYEPNSLRAEVQRLLNLSLEWHVPLFVGEWGMQATAPGVTQYINDSLSIYERESISSTWWDYSRGSFSMDLFDTQGNQRQVLVQNLVRPFLRETSTRVNVTTTFNATIRAYEQSIEFPNQTSNTRQRVLLTSVPLGFSWTVKNISPGLGDVEVQFFPQTRTLEVSVPSSVQEITLAYVTS